MKNKLIVLFLGFAIAVATIITNSKIVSKQMILSTVKTEEPNEIYGPSEAEIVLKIGNGGAGPTCLLQALSEDYIKSKNLNIRIAWVQTISRLTLENLKKETIDISLTYESEPELQAIQEDWASNRTLVFNDHFLIVGPKNNPAGILPNDTASTAFQKIAEHGAFFSRNDLSGSNQRERSIWEMLNLKPWENEVNWYVAEQVFPMDALKKADDQSLYTLTDRGTLLGIHDDLNNTAVYIQDDEQLMNRCHAMLQKNPSEHAKDFLAYLKSSRAQALIATYAGKNKEDCRDCCPLFTSAKEDQFLERNCLQKMGLVAKQNLSYRLK